MHWMKGDTENLWKSNFWIISMKHSTLHGKQENWIKTNRQVADTKVPNTWIFETLKLGKGNSGC